MVMTWVKQQKKATVLTVLAVLSVCAVTGYAAHVRDKSGHLWDDQVFYQIATGDHDWNDTDTYGYHYMNVENDLNTWVELTYKWKHELKQEDVVLKSDEIGNKGRPLRIESGETYSTSGWLNTYTAGGIPDGEYKIVSSTKIKLENGQGFIQDWISISKTTEFDVEDE